MYKIQIISILVLIVFIFLSIGSYDNGLGITLNELSLKSDYVIEKSEDGAKYYKFGNDNSYQVKIFTDGLDSPIKQIILTGIGSYVATIGLVGKLTGRSGISVDQRQLFCYAGI